MTKLWSNCGQSVAQGVSNSVSKPAINIMDSYILTKNDICSEDYETLRQFLQKNCGVVLGDNKHALVINRLQRLPGLFGVMSFKELVGQSLTYGGDITGSIIGDRVDCHCLLRHLFCRTPGTA